MNNTITQLFGIKYPLIQAGMIWCSGWELASAVSNAGGLGIIGSGSMYPNVLREHIQKRDKYVFRLGIVKIGTLVIHLTSKKLKKI